MADQQVEIVYNYSDGNGHVPGDRQTLDVAEAKRIKKAGVADYATIPDAKKAGADPSEAATAKK